MGKALNFGVYQPVKHFSTSLAILKSMRCLIRIANGGIEQTGMIDPVI